MDYEIIGEELFVYLDNGDTIYKKINEDFDIEKEIGNIEEEFNIY